MAAQIFNLGKLRFTYKGAYSGATEYQLNDVVKYTNNLYVYINTGATTGNAPTNTSYWSKMIDGYTDPASGSNGQFLQTTGSAFQFATVSQVPSQSGQAGKFLKTDGSTASWSNEIVTLDVTGDLEVGTTAGEIYVGNGARNDAETLGTSVINVTTKSLTSNVATITTATAHGFAPFQFVTIALSPADAAFDGTYEITSTPTLNTFTFDKVTGNIGSQATVGTVSAIPGYTNLVAAFAVDADDDFAQVAFRNRGNGVNSSTDFIVYPDNGTDFAGWFSHGVTSSAFADPEFTLTGPNDAYLFYDAPTDTTGAGNLVIATGDKGSQNKIIFAAGGLQSDNEQMSITPDQNVHIEITTQSTSPTTGALTVVGGVGVSGNLNVLGDTTITGNLTFGGGSTTTANLTVTDPIVFVGNANSDDLLDLGLVGEYATTISAIVTTVTNKALTSNVATLTTSTSHTYLVGDIVVVTGVDATFNGTYAITAVTSNTFSYAKTNANVSSAAATGSASVSKRRKYAGVLRDASDGIIKFYKDGTTKPTSTANFGEAGAAFADIRVGGLTASGTVSLSGTVDIQEMRETVVSLAISSNAIAADWSSGNIFWVTSTPSANFTVNLTNVPTDNDRVMTVNVFVTQGATGRIPNAITINGGSSEPIKWASGSAPTPTSTSGRIDAFTFTLFRLSNSWTVLGSPNLNWG